MSRPTALRDAGDFDGLRACVRTSGSVSSIRCSNAKSVQTSGAILRARLIDEINEKLDSLRFYRLGANWQSRIEHVGAKAAYDPDGPLMF